MYSQYHSIMISRISRLAGILRVGCILPRGIATLQSFDNYSSNTPISNSEFSIMMDECKMSSNSNKKLIVALSGGPDSMALLYLLNEWTNKSRLVAVTIDHGFRDESSKEAETVHEWVSKLQIEHVIRKIDWISDNSFPAQAQLEREGRQSRYNLLKSVCESYHTQDVVVAHHGDDQLETFLMRFYRGSGYAGLSCIRRCQEMNDGTRRIRPLLSISKARILSTCSSRSIPYVIDPSNTDLNYDRNRVREGISQIRKNNAMDVSRIFTAIDYFQKIRDATDKETSNALTTCCQYNKEFGICRLNCTKLSSFSDYIISSVLKIVCSGIGGTDSPSDKALQRVTRVILTEKGIKKPMQLAGCMISELKFCSSVYAKKRNDDTWICVCIDRSQLLQRNIDTRAIDLQLNTVTQYINQYLVSIREEVNSRERLKTIESLPFLDSVDYKTTHFSVSFLPDQMLQGILCSNRGLLTRKNLSDIIARSLPAIFANIDGKKQLVYSSILGVNRIQNISFDMKAVPRIVFRDVVRWIIY